MVIADNTPAAAEGHHRCLKRFGQFENLLPCLHGAPTHHDHRPFRSCQDLGRLKDQVRVRPKRSFGAGLFRHADLGYHVHRVPAHFELNRPRATGLHLPEGFRHQAGGIGRMFDPGRPFGQGPHRRQLVRQLVELPPPLPQLIRRDLSGDAQNRGIGCIGCTQRGGGVQHARARHDGIGTYPPARLGIPEGHVRCGLLMAGSDDVDVPVVKGIEQAVDLHARQAENRVNAVFEQRLNNRISS